MRGKTGKSSVESSHVAEGLSRGEVDEELQKAQDLLASIEGVGGLRAEPAAAWARWDWISRAQ